jgi:hypothetical protein
MPAHQPTPDDRGHDAVDVLVRAIVSSPMAERQRFLEALMQKIENQIIDSDEDLQDLATAVLMYERVAPDVDAFALAPEMTVQDLNRRIDHHLEQGGSAA